MQKKNLNSKKVDVIPLKDYYDKYEGLFVKKNKPYQTTEARKEFLLSKKLIKTTKNMEVIDNGTIEQ